MEDNMNRRHHTLFFTLFLLIPLVVLGLSQSQVKNSNKDPSETRPKKQLIDYSRYFTEEGPSGKWFVAAATDVSQRANNGVPVVIDSVRSLLGKGKFVNLIVKRVALLNR